MSWSVLLRRSARSKFRRNFNSKILSVQRRRRRCNDKETLTSIFPQQLFPCFYARLVMVDGLIQFKVSSEVFPTIPVSLSTIFGERSKFSFVSHRQQSNKKLDVQTHDYLTCWSRTTPVPVPCVDVAENNNVMAVTNEVPKYYGHSIILALILTRHTPSHSQRGRHQH